MLHNRVTQSTDNKDGDEFLKGFYLFTRSSVFLGMYWAGLYVLVTLRGCRIKFAERCIVELQQNLSPRLQRQLVRISPPIGKLYFNFGPRRKLSNKQIPLQNIVLFFEPQ